VVCAAQDGVAREGEVPGEEGWERGAGEEGRGVEALEVEGEGDWLGGEWWLGGQVARLSGGKWVGR
jgi:hypothetical protein